MSINKIITVPDTKLREVSLPVEKIGINKKDFEKSSILRLAD